MRRLCIYCKKSFFSVPKLTARRAPKCSAPSNLGQFCSGPVTPNTSTSVTTAKEPTSRKRTYDTQSKYQNKLKEPHNVKRQKLNHIEIEIKNEKLPLIAKKIKTELKDNSHFFQQSPRDAGGYNPRSQHGSLGSSHTIGNKAAKTGLAISGQAPITMDFSATSFGASYLNQLGQSINVALDETYHIPSYQPGLTSTPKLRTLYIQLQRKASCLLVNKITDSLDLSSEQLPNADNNYPSVLVPFILKANIIKRIHKKISLSVAQEKAQEVFTMLMATVFVYYASRLGLSVTHRSSFGHVQISVAPCDTHMRITLGILDPQDFNNVMLATKQTYKMADQFTSDDNFIKMMCLRESDAAQAKSALYSVVERNLKKAYYAHKVVDELFGHFTDTPTIVNVITYINQLLITDREPSIPYFSEQELEIYTHDWRFYLQQYRLAFGVNVNMSQRDLLNSMSSISQYRMLEFAKKRQDNAHDTTEKWGQDDVSDSEDEIILDDEDCPTFYHKKAGGLNGMHCVHKIMDAICHQQKYKQQSLFLSYNTQKMYFETNSVFDKWLSIFRLTQPNIRRVTPAFQHAKPGETSLNILFTDINHCNVSYDSRGEGIFKPTDFKRRQGATYDYYILDITSALPEEVNDSIQKIINLNKTAVIFTLSSLLKLGQLGADFFSQGEIRIFTSSEQQLQELYGSMQQDRNNTYLASQEPRRFMKQVSGSMTIADIFPKAQFNKTSQPKK
ncbi:hypothetical protein [Paraglaciecola sp.]|uniref:hypothetical protein n=1 Tax=Paraglaciecola sp. TaxID=1920173 RepID=UPI0030F48E27